MRPTAQFGVRLFRPCGKKSAVSELPGRLGGHFRLPLLGLRVSYLRSGNPAQGFEFWGLGLQVFASPSKRCRLGRHSLIELILDSFKFRKI